MRPPQLVLLVLAACGSSGSDSGPDPGRETGPCDEDRCLSGLVCLSDVCVDPTPDSESATGDDGAEPAPDPGETVGPVPDPDPTSGDDGNDSTSDGDGAGEDAGGTELGETGDLDPDPDPDDIPAACLAFAETWCTCLGELAADDCFETVADGCDFGYEYCPEWYACATATLCDPVTEACGDCIE